MISLIFFKSPKLKLLLLYLLELFTFSEINKYIYHISYNFFILFPYFHHKIKKKPSNYLEINLDINTRKQNIVKFVTVFDFF
jgi:hypothetical protein